MSIADAVKKFGFSSLQNGDPSYFTPVLVVVVLSTVLYIIYVVSISTSRFSLNATDCTSSPQGQTYPRSKAFTRFQAPCQLQGIC